MSTEEKLGSMRRLALEFMRAYWRGDLEAALGSCTADAVLELPKSLSIVTPARIRDVLPGIFAQVFTRFENGRFDTAVERVLADDSAVFVEYRASGKLAAGGLFDCQYAAVLEIEGGKVASFRQYTDTLYVARELKV